MEDQGDHQKLHVFVFVVIFFFNNIYYYDYLVELTFNIAKNLFTFKQSTRFAEGTGSSFLTQILGASSKCAVLDFLFMNKNELLGVLKIAQIK